MTTPNKIITGLDKLDNLFEGGLKKGELSVIMAQPSNGNKTNLIRYYQQRLIEQGKKDGYVIINHEIPMAKTTYEKLGDTIFPVTKFPNGIVVVDYPDNALIPKKNV